MPKWINLEFAIDKYGFSEDIIELWADMSMFSLLYIGGKPYVDEKGMVDFLHHHRSPPSEEYLFALEKKCISDAKILNLYSKTLGLRNEELMQLKSKIAQICNGPKHIGLMQNIRSKLKRWM